MHDHYRKVTKYRKVKKKKKEKQPQSLTIPWPTAYILGPLNEELHVKP